MSKVFNKISSMAAVAALVLVAAASCSKHDPYYDDVTPPEIEPAECNISGLVTNKQGEPIVNATISFPDGSVVYTGADGTYRAAVTASGLLTLTASAQKYISETGSVRIGSLKKSEQYVLNFVLSQEQVVKFVFLKAEDQINSETIIHNNIHGVITVDAETISQAISEFETLYMQPVYSKAQAELLSKASYVEEKLLIGANFFSSDPTRVTLNAPIQISFNINSDTQKYVRVREYYNGKWIIPENMTFDENGVYIQTTHLTSFGVLSDVEIEKIGGEVALSYELDDYNNLYGSKVMPIGSSKYTYRVGVDLDTYQGTDQLRALLLEKLAQDYGMENGSVSTEYPINIDLPIGIRLTVSGGQYYEDVYYSRGGRTVMARVWGNTWTETHTYNRSHTGGGSLL